MRKVVKFRMGRVKQLLQAKHLAHVIQIGLGNEDTLAQLPFALGGFARQDMAAKRLLAFDFSVRGHLETLGRAAVGFHLWHHGAFLTVRLAPLEGRAL